MRVVSRDIATYAPRRVVQRLLQTVLTGELIAPSPRIWLVSAWVSDIEVLDNQGREFSALQPEWPTASIPLAMVLEALADQGARIAVVMNEERHNNAFARRLEPLVERGMARVYRSVSLHRKGMLGDGFVIEGSMNFTYRGMTMNDEHLIYRTDPAVVAERRLDYDNTWPVP